MVLAASLVGTAVVSGSPETIGQATPRPGVPRPPDPKVEARKVPALLMESAWIATLPALAAERPAFDDHRAFVPMQNGHLAAVSLATGAIDWTVERSSAVSPAAGAGLVFIAEADGLIAALDAATGAVRWERPLGGKPRGPLAWQNGWLLAATEAGRVTMIRAHDGTVIWTREWGSPLAADAAMAADRLFLLLEDHRVVAVQLATGDPAWVRRLSGRGSSVLPLDDRLFVGADDKVLYCLALENGRLMWRWQAGGAIVGVPVVDEENIYFLSLDHLLRALDRGNGHQRWKRALEMRPAAGPFLDDGLVLVAGVSPEIRGYQAVDGSPAGTVAAAGDLVAPPRPVPSERNRRRSLVVVTGEGQVQRMIPGLPILKTKPITKLPTIDFRPAIVGGDPDWIGSASSDVVERISGLRPAP